MTDPLGRSQVLPYLERLAAKGHAIRLFSLEKADAAARSGAFIADHLARARIDWHPLPYRSRPPLIAGWWNGRRLAHSAAASLRRTPADILHARSDLPARIALSLRRRFGGKLLWDMRALWPDERAEGGAWDQGSALGRFLFSAFKALQRRLVREADAVVTLSEAGGDWLANEDVRGPVTVIPCCADFDHFRPDRVARQTRRAALGLTDGERLFIHLGSIGGNVLLDEMMAFLARAAARDPATRGVFLAPGEHDRIRKAADAHGFGKHLKVAAAEREAVPSWIAAADVGLFFVRPSPAKVAASPTKLGEMLASGLPVVTGPAIGDVERIVADCRAGVVVPRFDDAAYDDALCALDEVDVDPQQLRTAARRWFDVEDGADRYDQLYRALKAESAATKDHS